MTTQGREERRSGVTWRGIEGMQVRGMEQMQGEEDDERQINLRKQNLLEMKGKTREVTRTCGFRVLSHRGVGAQEEKLIAELRGSRCSSVCHGMLLSQSFSSTPNAKPYDVRPARCASTCHVLGSFVKEMEMERI